MSYLHYLQAGSNLGRPRDLTNTTPLEVNHLPSGITDYYAQVATVPSGVFPVPMQVDPIYGFNHSVPSVPVDSVIEEMRPYESTDWPRLAPVTRTTPGADSPWSERDGPPPPYILSPGTYHLRLEAATRTSPPPR